MPIDRPVDRPVDRSGERDPVGARPPGRAGAPVAPSPIRVVRQPRITATVAIIDTHPMFRRGVASALVEGQELQASIVMDTSDVERAIAARAGLDQPGIDVAIVAADLVDAAGVPAPVRIQQEWPQARVVAITNGEDDAALAAAVRAGARGYLVRDCSADDVRQVVGAAAAGTSMLPPQIATRLLDEFALMARRAEQGPHGVGALSKREREVLSLVAEGLNNRAIANRLFISENTVKNHIRNIHDKLGVHTRMEAVVRGVREGLLRIT